MVHMHGKWMAPYRNPRSRKIQMLVFKNMPNDEAEGSEKWGGGTPEPKVLVHGNLGMKKAFYVIVIVNFIYLM